MVLEALEALAREASSSYIRVDLADKLRGLAHSDPAIERVYGKPLTEIEVPKGYVLTGEFRKPRAGEWFICDMLYAIKATEDWGSPRLILREKPPMPKPPEGFELTGEYRVPKKGEYWYGSAGQAVRCYGEYSEADTFWILRKKPASPAVPTVESVYGKPLAELKPPKGFRFTGEFRPTRMDESYMSVVDGSTSTSGTDWSSHPRLILKPAKRLVFDIIDENRSAKRGEWSRGQKQNSGALRCHSDTVAALPFILSEPRVEEAQS